MNEKRLTGEKEKKERRVEVVHHSPFTVHRSSFIVYLSLGSNLGDKEQNLHRAVQKIEERIGKVISLSALYATAPWGFQSAHSFLNTAVGVRTSLSPQQILNETQQIEKELGRARKSVNGCYSDRLIDIDLLLYGDWTLNEENLVIPHPLMTERRFVMEPLAEIAPDVVHPVLRKTIKELLLSSPQ